MPETTPKFFIPEDFDIMDGDFADSKEAAEIANRILSERGVRVYRQFHSGKNGCAAHSDWSEVPSHDTDNESALVIDIQPIRKGVKKSEIQTMKERVANRGWVCDREEVAAFLDRIEREGIVNE